MVKTDDNSRAACRLRPALGLPTAPASAKQCPVRRGVCTSGDELHPHPRGDARRREAEARSHRPPCLPSIAGPPRTGVSRGLQVFSPWPPCRREDGVPTRRPGCHSWTGAGTVGGRLSFRSTCGAARSSRWSAEDAPPQKGMGDSLRVWEESRMARRGCPEEAGALGLMVSLCGLGPPGTGLLGLSRLWWLLLGQPPRPRQGKPLRKYTEASGREDHDALDSPSQSCGILQSQRRRGRAPWTPPPVSVGLSSLLPQQLCREPASSPSKRCGCGNSRTTARVGWSGRWGPDGAGGDAFCTVGHFDILNSAPACESPNRGLPAIFKKEKMRK